MMTYALIIGIWAAVGWLCGYWASRSWDRRWAGPIARYGDEFKAPIGPWIGMFLGPIMIGAVGAEIAMRNNVHD